MTSRGMKLALGVSVALNLFLAGAGIGGGLIAWKHWKDGARRAVPIYEAARVLPPQEQAALRHTVHAAAVQARPDFEQARAARREAARLAGAASFDRAAVAAQLERSRAAEIRGRVMLEKGVLDAMSTMSPEDRAVVAPSLMRKIGPRGGRQPGPPPAAPQGPPPAP